MFFVSFVLSLLLALHTIAAPINDLTARSPARPQDVSNGGVPTPIGIANGTVLSNGVARFAVRYATSSRWQAPTPATTWHMPNNDPAALPPWCPQPNAASSQYSEDCLYLIMHVPITAALGTSKLNTFFWIHGGSFKTGSATNAGLDGSKFALASKSIVVTVQYRLGVLGFLPPSSQNQNINLGVKDVTEALSFLQKVLPSFNGDASQITVAGQSSGGAMIRALLAAPTAAAKFKNGIIQSDPMFWNFLPRSAYTALQSSYFSSLPSSCSSSPASCSLDTILSSQSDFYDGASSVSAAAGSFEPLRPTVDGSFITTSLSGSSYPSQLKPLIVTTVANEAGLQIGQSLPPDFPTDYFPGIVDAQFGDERTNTIMAAPYYAPMTQVKQDTDQDVTREALEKMGTDASWRCSSWSFARAYAARGGRVYSGAFQIGATYAGTESVAFCTTNSRVCHQDDIYITFGTTPSPSAAQSALTTEVQARWSSFMKTSDVNPLSSPYAHWNAAGSNDVQSLWLGGTGGQVSAAACIPSFWGSSVLYDWQIYGV